MPRLASGSNQLRNLWRPSISTVSHACTYFIASQQKHSQKLVSLMSKKKNVRISWPNHNLEESLSNIWWFNWHETAALFTIQMSGNKSSSLDSWILPDKFSTSGRLAFQEPILDDGSGKNGGNFRVRHFDPEKNREFVCFSDVPSESQHLTVNHMHKRVVRDKAFWFQL